MNHNKDTPIEPIYTSTSKFGVNFENQFIALDDGKHVIGVDPSDASKLIIENIETGKADKFGWRNSSDYIITTLVYDEDTGSFYSGDTNGRLFKCKLDKTSKTFERVKDFGDLGIGYIISSYRFKHFVFFGGILNRIIVLDLSTGELLPRHLETAIGCICSLQVCVMNHNKIYLAVSGTSYNYSGDKTDLFDVTDLLQVDPVFLQKYL